MVSDPQPTSPDWGRLQRALSVEAESGFNDLVGKQQTFSEFLRDSLQQPPGVLPPDQQQSWQSLAQKYSDYGDLGFAQRQHLVAETRRFLYGTQRMLEQFSKTKAQRGQTVGELGALARGCPWGIILIVNCCNQNAEA